MNKREADRLFAVLQTLWPARPLNPELPTLLVQTLGDMPLNQCEAAVNAISRQGGDWVPTPGAIRLEAARLEVAPPAWDEVRQQLMRRRDELSRMATDGFAWDHEPCKGTSWIVNAKREAQPCSCRDDYIRARRAEHTLPALVRLWLDDGYVTWSEVDAVADGDTTAEAQMRRKWEQYADRMVQARVMRGLPGGAGAPALERAAADDQRRIEQDRRRSSLRALGSGPSTSLASVVGENTNEEAPSGR